MGGDTYVEKNENGQKVDEKTLQPGEVEKTEADKQVITPADVGTMPASILEEPKKAE